MGNDNFKVYVGNLPFSYTTDELSQLFAEYGSVQEAILITDRDTGRSRGFGFVRFATAAEAEKAIAGANGKQLGDRSLVVNHAKAKTDNQNSGRRY